MCWIAFLLLSSKILSHPLAFSSLNLSCLGVHVIKFILLWAHWASWVCKLMFFIQFRKVLATFSLNIVPSLFLVPYFLRVCLRWHAYWGLTGFQGSVHFSPFLACIITTDLTPSAWILLPTQICLGVPLVNFSLQLLYFSTAISLFVFLLFFLIVSIWWDIFFIFPFHSLIMI